MKKLALVVALTVAGSTAAWAAGGPLTFAGNTASFSSSVNGTFTDVWTFTVLAPGASAASSITNISFAGAGGIGSFAAVLAAVSLTGTVLPSPPVLVNVLSGFTGVLTPGPYSLVVSGIAGAGASYGGNVVLTPIPEPETYALMLAGLAIVGGIAMRRRSQG